MVRNGSTILISHIRSSVDPSTSLLEVSGKQSLQEMVRPSCSIRQIRDRRSSSWVTRLNNGAMDSETSQLAALSLLSQHLTVFHDDRRGEATAQIRSRMRSIVKLKPSKP